MKAQIALWFPFVLAVVLPVAGLVYGGIQIASGERETGVRVIMLAVIAGTIQAFYVLS